MAPNRAKRPTGRAEGERALGSSRRVTDGSLQDGVPAAGPDVEVGPLGPGSCLGAGLSGLIRSRPNPAHPTRPATPGRRRRGRQRREVGIQLELHVPEPGEGDMIEFTTIPDPSLLLSRKHAQEPKKFKAPIDH